MNQATIVFKRNDKDVVIEVFREYSQDYEDEHGELVMDEWTWAVDASMEETNAEFVSNLLNDVVRIVNNERHLTYEQFDYGWTFTEVLMAQLRSQWLSFQLEYETH